jgi:hydroxymethylpyrimidine pyrophosphatase-like HAD family hydrolase
LEVQLAIFVKHYKSMLSPMDLSHLRSQIKLIASDIDGTLLNSSHQLPKETEHALKAFAESHPHIPFVLATGKTLYGSKDIIDKFSFLGNAYGIFLNGGIVIKKDPTVADSPIPGYRICYDCHIDGSEVLFYLKLCKQWNFTMVLYSYDVIYAPHPIRKTEHDFFLDRIS